jgi:hypothetical protein
MAPVLCVVECPLPVDSGVEEAGKRVDLPECISICYCLHISHVVNLTSISCHRQRAVSRGRGGVMRMSMMEAGDFGRGCLGNRLQLHHPSHSPFGLLRGNMYHFRYVSF